MVKQIVILRVKPMRFAIIELVKPHRFVKEISNFEV